RRALNLDRIRTDDDRRGWRRGKLRVSVGFAGYGGCTTRVIVDCRLERRVDHIVIDVEVNVQIGDLCHELVTEYIPADVGVTQHVVLSEVYRGPRPGVCLKPLVML